MGRKARYEMGLWTLVWIPLVFYNHYIEESMKSLIAATTVLTILLILSAQRLAGADTSLEYAVIEAGQLVQRGSSPRVKLTDQEKLLLEDVRSRIKFLREECQLEAFFATLTAGTPGDDNFAMQLLNAFLGETDLDLAVIMLPQLHDYIFN